MKTLITILLLFLLATISYGQKASLSGKVVDGISNEPLPFVNVLVSGTTTGTVTDEKGHFEFDNLNPGFIRLASITLGKFSRMVKTRLS